MRRILVTGAATWTGSRLIQMLEQRDDVLVMAVDELRPSLEFASSFYKVSLDRPEFARFLLDVGPETVVHLQTVDRVAELGRGRAHEGAVVGAQALFGAIGRSPDVRHVIVKSDATVYGSGPRNPSIFAEGTLPQGRRSRYSRDLTEMEGFLRDVAESHSHVDYTILRFASVLGPTVGNPISRFVRLRVVPTQLGFDPRLQFIYEDDAVAALQHTVLNPVSGTFNIASQGQMYLSRVLRLGGRIHQPLPRRGFDAALRALARLDLYVPDHLARLLRYGRVLDTAQMRQRLGFEPVRSCREAVLASYGRLPDRVDT